MHTGVVPYAEALFLSRMPTTQPQVVVAEVIVVEELPEKEEQRHAPRLLTLVVFCRPWSGAAGGARPDACSGPQPHSPCLTLRARLLHSPWNCRWWP